MTTLEEGFRTLTRIAENHGISAQEERRLLEEMKSFSVSVQLLGPYHAGKSALLNALLDSRILPAGLDEGPVVPIELAWGEKHCSRLAQWIPPTVWSRRAARRPGSHWNFPAAG